MQDGPESAFRTPNEWEKAAFGVNGLPFLGG